MFKKILIANRGEIAVRIIRACRELGIRSAAVFSEVDRKSLHVRLADEAYPIGPAPSRESYLRIDKIIDVARRAGCDAIHPGYGFLAENAALPRACLDTGLTFIGPPAEAMESLGSKTAGRQLARRAEVPTVPGTNDPIENLSEAQALAQRMSPVLIIDGDMRKGSVAKALGIKNEKGLSTVLSGDHDFSEATQKRGPNLWVLPSGPVPHNPAELLASQAMKNLLENLGTNFRHVIIDSPPVLAVTDATIISSLADGVLLVAARGSTPRTNSRVQRIGRTRMGRSGTVAR